MVSKKIRSNILGMAIACLFIFNPNISVIDVLPDFIGYIILSFCLLRIADLNESLYEARIAINRMILIDAAKTAALVWTFGMSVTSEYTSSLMLWSFVFCTLEIIFAVPAFVKLFTGILRVADFYPSDVIFFRNKRLFSNKLKTKNVTENIRTFTAVFLVLKAVLSFFPELADLSNTAYDETSAVTVNLYQFIGLLRFLAFLPILILGVIWLIKVSCYFFKLSKDERFINALSFDYESKILIKKGIFIKRNIQLSFVIFIVASVFTLDFRLDNINFIPDLIPAILFLVFFIIIKKYSDSKKRIGVGLSIFYISVSAASYISEIFFFSEYSYNAIMRSDAALFSFIAMLALNAIKAVAFILVIFAIYASLCNIISNHTGYVLGRENVTDATERQVSTLHKELKNSMKFFIAAAIVYAFSDIAYLGLIDILGFMGIVNGVFGILFVITVIRAQNEIMLSVNTKYMLD